MSGSKTTDPASFDYAEEKAQQLADSHLRAWTMFKLGIAALDNGEIERGRSLLHKSLETWRPEQGNRWKAIALARLGMYPEWERMLRRIIALEELGEHDALVASFAVRGRDATVAQLQQSSNIISDERTRYAALVAAGRVMIEVGRQDEALALAGTLPVGHRGALLLDILSQYLRNGDPEGAIRCAESIPDELHRSRAGLKIAEAYMRRSERSASERWMAYAERSAGMIKDADLRNSTLISIADLQLKCGMREKASMHIGQFLTDQQSLPDRECADRTWADEAFAAAECARMLVHHRRVDEAREALERVVDDIQACSSVGAEGLEAIANVASVWVLLDGGDAVSGFAPLLTPEQRRYIVNAAVETSAREGDLQSALATAEKIPDAEGRAWAKLHVARGLNDRSTAVQSGPP